MREFQEEIARLKEALADAGDGAMEEYVDENGNVQQRLVQEQVVENVVEVEKEVEKVVEVCGASCVGAVVLWCLRCLGGWIAVRSPPAMRMLGLSFRIFIVDSHRWRRWSRSRKWWRSRGSWRSRR